MYHLRSVTLSFMKRNSIIYDAQVTHLRMACSKSSLPKQGGLGWVSSWGGSPVAVGLLFGFLQTLHRKALES